MNHNTFLIRILAFLALYSSVHAQSGVLGGSAETGMERETFENLEQIQAVLDPQPESGILGPALAEVDSLVFGASLFAPDVQSAPFTAFNPSYQIQRGDRIRLQVWGAVALNGVLQVDAQGNIFIPEIGPVTVAGVENRDLNEVVSGKISEIYIDHVNAYANLETAQEVKVYVAGFVNRPGLYGGLASENLINYIKLAGGIDLSRGSFIRVDVKRGEELRHSVNLYDFLTEGTVPLIQFADGDVIFVHPIQSTLMVEGLAKNAFQFEFESASLSGSELLRLARPDAVATTAVVKRSVGAKASVVNLAISEVEDFSFRPGDRVTFSADRRKETILVNIEGEHEGDGYVVMPYGSTVGDLYAQLNFSSFSNADAIQLFRKSVQVRQKEAILASLQRLENNVLSARSSTADEARLRAAEAELLLQFVDRARNVEPLGQVVLNGDNWRDIRLEEDDRIVIPGLSNLIMVQGEVNFPNTQVFRDDSKLKDYIEYAGGFTENAEKDKIILLRANGEINLVKERLIGSSKYGLNPGDEVIVLPEVDKKYFPVIRDLSQIIYNLAIATKVVLDV
ncbi:MAG: polysaccharide biosynthesis/export family protein [Opitutales bacterium]|nr:polysaccharide biosynthesis/export family protein [Opitutales bacterium]